MISHFTQVLNQLFANHQTGNVFTIAVVVIQFELVHFAVAVRLRLCGCQSGGGGRLDGLLLLFVGFPVRLLIEIVEQEIEENTVGQCEEDRPARIAAIGVEQLRGMEKGQAELNLQWGIGWYLECAAF